MQQQLIEVACLGLYLQHLAAEVHTQCKTYDPTNSSNTCQNSFVKLDIKCNEQEGKQTSINLLYLELDIKRSRDQSKRYCIGIV